MVMAMEVNSVVSDGFGDVNGSVNLYCDGSVVSVEASENPGNFLEDFDSYWEDIANRVTVSRMVSDSVIKGMVSAIEQEAAEKIAEKELELVRLKESLNHYHVAAEESEPFETPVMKCASGSVKYQSHSSFSDALSDYDRIGESVGSLKYVAEEQLKNLRTEMDRIKGSSSFRRIGSGNELVGLSGNLQGKALDIKWMNVDKALDSLKTTLDSMCKHAGNMVYLSKASLCQWQQEKEFQEEVEDMVIMNCIRNLKEEFEERLCAQNARFYDSESLNWFEKIKEIFNLRGELDAISKSLSVPEIGQLTSHGSIDMGEEWDTDKRTDHLQRKTTGNHVSLSISLSEGNGKHDESVFAMPENLDIELKHMEKDQLIKHFRNEMTEMKRNHEQKVAEMTEDYFTLRRGYLKDRGSSLPIKKDKEFDILRKKIPVVIMKLDEILVESEKLPNFTVNAEGLCSFRDRLDSLLSENCQLKSFLSEKQKEVKHLSLQISDTAEVKLQHSLAEANLVKRIRNLQDALDDVHIQTSISDDVNKCLLREAVDCLKSVSEKSDLEYKLIQDIYEIIYHEGAQNDKPNNECRLEDSDFEAVIMQQLCEVIFGEAIREAEVKLDELNRRYSDETERRISVENVAVEKERALRLEFSENEKLRQEIHLLSSLVEEKENLVNVAGEALFKEKNQSELISQELNRLRDETRQQQILISESSKEFDDTKGNLNKTLNQIEQYKVDVHELKQKLELAMKELRDTNEEKKMLLSLTEQKQCVISLLEAKGREQRKQMESLIFLIQGLSGIVTELECKVIKDIERCNFRLESLSSQSSGLIHQASIIKTTGLIYKQKLERRCSDLQKAEAEVDLLGDEVETLLSLLEKIYIALDHYSPILQHYPGILEILKLVRRELSGESTKRVSSAI